MRTLAPPPPAYDRAFYRRHVSGARSSAGVIVPLVVAWLNPRSVVDVGCGVGSWLAEFRRNGVEDVLGVDGPHVDRALLEIPADRFEARDLTKPVAIPRSFDLALCLEVAEHLPESSADALVGSLVALAPVILFSAAVPGQGGTGHVNEAWPEAWARRFSARGYDWADPIRPRVWTSRDVEPWYAQNALLYCRRGLFSPAPWGAAGTESGPRPEWPLPLVHPAYQERIARRTAPTVRNAWRDLRRALLAAMSRPFRR